VQQVSVTVNVPRSYFVKLFKQGKPETTPDPDDAALETIRQAQITQIQAQVEPLIASSTNKGVVKAYMIPDRAGVAMAGMATVAGGGGGGASLNGALDSTWIKPAGLSMLALVSLAMMFAMVRKATRQQPMPSVEELAGVPPTLPAEDDLVGEADETEASMAGVELDEDELRTRKIAEQIGEMVKANPAEAASLVRRWVRTEE
jgi:flagellar M-ring protein FliF